jgi:hypothetical protein
VLYKYLLKDREHSLWICSGERSSKATRFHVASWEYDLLLSQENIWQSPVIYTWPSVPGLESERRREGWEVTDEAL